jgi:hypothetical protein
LNFLIGQKKAHQRTERELAGGPLGRHRKEILTMSKRKIAQQREPDKLDRALIAGYRFTILLSPSKELVQIILQKPDGERFNDIFGPVGAGALMVLDKASSIADIHRAHLLSPGEARKAGGDG